MSDLTDTNRYIVRASDGLRADRYFPRQEFWLFRNPEVPIPTLSAFDTLVLMQRLLREPKIQRVTITRMTTDLESRLRTIGPKARPLDSFLTEERGGE